MTDRIYQALVGNDTDGTMAAVDVIKHEGKLWLVPHWLELPKDKVSRPARIIRFDNQQHQHVPQAMNQGWPEYMLNTPVPKRLLDGVPPQQPTSYEYADNPDIDVPESIRPLRTRPKN